MNDSSERPQVAGRNRSRRHTLIVYGHYFAITMGIVSVRWDSGQRRLQPSTPLRCYAVCANALVIGAAPLALLYAGGALDFYGDDKLMSAINVVNGAVRVLVVVVQLLLRWRRESFTCRFVTELAGLETEYFAATPLGAALERRYDRLLYAKCGSACFQIIAVAYTAVKFARSFTATWLALLVFLVCVQNILQGLVMYYYMALLHLWQRFEVLNERLREVFALLEGEQSCRVPQQGGRTRRQLQRALAAEVETVALLHGRLTRLVLALNANYTHHIGAGLVYRLLNIIALGFYGVMLFSGTVKAQLNYFDLAFGVVRYPLVLYDLFLVDVVCEATIVAHAETASIQKRFQELNVIDRHLERAIDMLSQQLLQHKLRLKICGLFDLSKQTSTVMFGAIVQHTIFLIQWDFGRRLH